MASRPSKFDFWERFRSGPGQWRVQQALEVWLLKRVLIRALATWRSKFDFWWEFQSEPGQRDLASMPATFDFWILLVRISIRAWTMWHGQHACKVWLLDSFGENFNQSLDNVTWPACLQSLTFGFFWWEFQSEPGQCDMASMPAKFDFWILLVRISIRAWTMWHGQHACKVWLLDSFGENFNQSLDNVTWPACLQSLTFGFFWWEFQSEPGQRDMASMPAKFDFWILLVRISIRAWTMWHGQHACKVWLLDSFGENFNQSLDNVTWPACLQSLTFGFFWWEFQSEPGQRDMASMPAKFDFWILLVRISIRAWTTWHGQHACKVWLLDSFGENFNQSLDNVTWPACLQSLTFGFFWWEFQSEPGQCDMASMPAKFDFWILLVRISIRAWTMWHGQHACKVWLLDSFGENFNQSLDNVTWPACLQSLTFGFFWWEFQSEPGQRDLASMPATFDFWILLVRISIRAWTTWDGQHACNVWLLVRISIRALSTWPGQHAFKVWLLVRISITAWTMWPGQHACNVWLLVRISIRALSTWPGQQAFKVWLLVRISIRAWTTWPGQHACNVWLLDTFGENFNQSLDNVTWPACLQRLTFGWEFQLEPCQRDLASRPSNFDFWWEFQSQPGQCDLASMPATFDFWWEFQSEPGQRDMASMPATFDFWWEFQLEPCQRDLASRPSNFDFWWEFESQPGQCDLASMPATFDFWW